MEHSQRLHMLVVMLAAVFAGAFRGAAQVEPPSKPAEIFGQMKYRYIGPPGNRVTSVVGVPGDPNIYYAGAASGGVWKSTDGGSHWSPIFDAEPVQSIGAISIAPSNPSIVWVGTGEPWLRSNVSLGDGVYKSIDSGTTWTHMGLEKTGRISRVIIDPSNPNIVYVAAIGTGYGPQPERGVFRTKDGGKTWDRVLFVDENTGASDLTMDPTDPQKLIAGTWQIDIKTWGRTSGGPGSGVFVTNNGGDTWKRLEGHGLPTTELGKIAVAIAPSDANRVYALIETGQGGTLWRSNDGGENWRVESYSRLLNERPHYYTRMLVMPDNENEVYFPSNSISATYDGGATSELVPWAGDNHDMWSDPKNPNRMMIGSDGGVSISTVRGRQWSETRLPIAQMYHVATDNRIPYFVYGQMQDGSPLRGPSNNLGQSNIPASTWITTAGCETGWSIPDPVDNNIVWGGCYAGVTERMDLRTGLARSVSVWPDRTMGANASQVKYRMNWTEPIAISPFDHNVVYTASQYVHKTSDGGQTWKIISPDLTLNDKKMMGDSGGLTIDNLSVEYAGVVFAIAESSVEKGQIWAGTNDGLLQLTRDGGAHWTNVTANLPHLPPKMTVVSIDPSKYDAGTCYVAFDGHQINIREPHLYKTTDFGRTWQKITTGIPDSPLSYTNVIQEDPVKKGLLYAGTENGLYISFNDGELWRPLQLNLPHAPVHWLTVQSHFNDLVVGTYGRGFWILDDVTPLQQWTDKVQSSPVYLFPPRESYRFRARSRRQMAPREAMPGQNPPYGASIDYYLKNLSKEKVEVSIIGPNGQTIRTLEATNKPGLNRTWWDLRYKPTDAVELRTTPPEHPHIWEEKRFAGHDTRPVFYYGVGHSHSEDDSPSFMHSTTGEPTLGPLAKPGIYTVKLTVGSEQLTQKLIVLKDPNTGASDKDVAESSILAVKVYNDANTSVRLINQIEWTRRQIEEMKKMLSSDAGKHHLIDSASALDTKFRAVEE
ncbi:MAG: VPS10 domain-containing protein, partial [Edaphobacter sp.]